MFKKILKNIFKIIFTVIIILVLFITILLVYYKTCVPDIIKDFDEYQGINFDYKVEESNYIDKLYYKQLTESEALHYRSMYHAAINDEAKYYLKNADLFDPDEVSRAVRAFDYDFPEYYWFGQVLYTDYESESDKLNLLKYDYVVVKAKCYGFNDNDILSNKTIIDNKLNEVLPKLVGDDEYATARNIYNYVIDNVEYNIDTIDTSDIRASFINGEGVCSSYAELFQMLCNRLGLVCYSVQGEGLTLYKDETNDNNKVEIEEDTLHEWNIINIDDNWYWVDTTWGDDDKKDYDIKNNLVTRYDYAYFLVPDRIFFLDHIPDKQFVYPICEDEQLYLHNNSGAIIDEYDDSLIDDYIVNAFKEGRNEFAFHFLNTNDVDLFINWIDKKKFYNAYQYNIYEYYDGKMNYYVSNNCSVYMNWHITNLY